MLSELYGGKGRFGMYSASGLGHPSTSCLKDAMATAFSKLKRCTISSKKSDGASSDTVDSCEDTENLSERSLGRKDLVESMGADSDRTWRWRGFDVPSVDGTSTVGGEKISCTHCKSPPLFWLMDPVADEVKGGADDVLDTVRL